MSTGTPVVTADEWDGLRRYVDDDGVDRMVVTLGKLRAFLGCQSSAEGCEFSDALNELRLLAGNVGEAPNDLLAWRLFALSQILTAKTMALIGAVETIQVELGKLNSGFPERFVFQEFDGDYELDLANDSTPSRLIRFTRGDFSRANDDDAGRTNSKFESDT